MTCYVALLRGINVGKNKRVPMPGLREGLEAAGYSDVRTMLVSGNVLLTPPDGRGAQKIAEDVSRVVLDGWGHDVRVVVRTCDELRDVVNRSPVPEPADGSRFFVAFLSEKSAAPIPAPENPGDDGWWTADREVYVWCPDGLLQSPAMGHLNALHLGVHITVRNWNTVTKLADLAER